MSRCPAKRWRNPSWPRLPWQVSKGVDIALAGLSLESDVTPSELFHIMASMLREAEAAMARGTSSPTLAGSPRGAQQRQPGQQPWQGDAAASGRVEQGGDDQGRAATTAGEASGVDAGSAGPGGRAAAAAHRTGSGDSDVAAAAVAAGLRSPPRPGAVDWGRVLAGPSGAAGLNAQQGMGGEW